MPKCSLIQISGSFSFLQSLLNVSGRHQPFYTALGAVSAVGAVKLPYWVRKWLIICSTIYFELYYSNKSSNLISEGYVLHKRPSVPSFGTCLDPQIGPIFMPKSFWITRYFFLKIIRLSRALCVVNQDTKRGLHIWYRNTSPYENLNWIWGYIICKFC